MQRGFLLGGLMVVPFILLMGLFGLAWVAMEPGGLSVLYLFLLADLLCAAVTFPVFLGLYSRRHDGVDALVATLAGLAAGLWMFPRPGQPLDTLLESFLLAACVPVIVTGLMRLLRRRRHAFALETLDDGVRRFDREDAQPTSDDKAPLPAQA